MTHAYSFFSKMTENSNGKMKRKRVVLSVEDKLNICETVKSSERRYHEKVKHWKIYGY